MSDTKLAGGVGTSIPPVVLPGRGAVVTGNTAGTTFGGRKASPTIKSEKAKPKFIDVKTLPGWATQAAPPKESPPEPRGPRLIIEKYVAGLDGKDVGSSVEMTIRGTITSVRKDENGSEYEIEVSAIAL